MTGDGQGQFSSREMQAVEDKTLLMDTRLMELKNNFNGTLVANADKSKEADHG